MRTVAAVVALVACVHAGLWLLGREKVNAPNFDGQLASVSYAPFQGNVNPEDGGKAETAKIRQDLTLLSPIAKSLRTYSSTAGVELVPGIAAEFGMRVTVGAWIDKDQKRNEREMRSVVDLAKRHSNVNGIFVGNETIYRGELEPKVGDKLDPEEAEQLKAAKTKQQDAKVREDIGVARLIKMIRQVKRQVNVPVTTGEIYSVWLDHPELVSSVDYIAAHILPYWEGFSDKQVVDQAITIYDKLRRAYPGKRVVIAEFGWPSAGYNFHNAEPGRIEQAVILRDFVTRAQAYGIDYNIVEAIDQPWKIFEGGVGPYWGIFNADRQAKFAWTGPITNPDYWKLGAIALLVSILLSLPILTVASVSFWQTTTLAAAANVVGAWSAALFGYWYGHYFVPGAAFALALGTVLLIPLIVIALARVEEIAAIAFGRKPARLVPLAPPLAPDMPTPKVSIHIPAYREPPEMLKQTLDAVAALDYANFECIVVVNNTPDPAMWMPIEEHCKQLGDRFKFVLANNLKGFKAGALRLADSHTAEDAEVIGIIDADYVVTNDWLRDLMPLFNDPTVGMVQAPQDHRDGHRSPLHAAMNAEYAGFFDIGMVQRNEHNAIVTHGTMVLMRRKAIEAVGGWSSDTICEDTDLGLCLLEHGWQAHYTSKRYGYGLLPDTYDAFKKQRDRWAYGGFQILKKHWRRMLSRDTRLTGDQKREFALGWLNWLGAESVGVVVAILNILWVPVIAFLDISVPDRILTVPIVASFIVSLVHFVALYRLRVKTTRVEMAAAAIAAMSVQWTVARAVAMGLIKDHLPFVRTDKGGGRRKTDFHAFWESVMAALLVAGAITLIETNYKEVREIYIFAFVLLVQALPFAAAVVIALWERSRINDFAVLEGYRATFATLARRARLAKVTQSVAPQQIAAKQPELTQ
ncbi:glycosyl transferase family 2 [Pseudolabrys sp. Root1462]|uniref:glycosyltransferase n=1 Tax=Pseudolabrys sp. Root1462 TaxID=1736466 RepID=UPI000702E395|nr:glycosyltransferase [Pseudolabrys sp. Root1462]KQZ01103.1 glycosyl transferase family 2 [Pseudolabrys sp. Root1462]